MKRLKGVPWEPVPGRPDTEIKSKVLIPGGDPVRAPGGETRERQVRRVYIRREDVTNYGPTRGCEGCNAAIRGDGISRNHTEECRGRFTRKIEEDNRGRVHRAQDRMREYEGLVEERERHRHRGIT